MVQPMTNDDMLSQEAVLDKAAKFGRTMTLVERRKQALQKKWDECKVSNAKVRTEWYKSPKSGVYKKRHILDWK